MAPGPTLEPALEERELQESPAPPHAARDAEAHEEAEGSEPSMLGP